MPRFRFLAASSAGVLVLLAEKTGQSQQALRVSGNQTKKKVDSAAA